MKAIVTWAGERGPEIEVFAGAHEAWFFLSGLCYVTPKACEFEYSYEIGFLWVRVAL